MRKWLGFIGAIASCLLGIAPDALSQKHNNLIGQINFQKSTPALPQLPARFTVFPVGIIVSGRAVISSVLVRGRENGTEAVDFANWLVPFDAVVEALKLKVKPSDNGILELRSNSIVTRVDTKQLINDQELGLVFSVQQLQTLLGVQAKFDIQEYAIALNPPQATSREQTGVTESPVQLTGLPVIKAPTANIAAVEQRLTTTNSGGNNLNAQGELQAVGTLFNGSGYVRLNQPDIKNSRTWNLAEAQYLQQKPFADYVVGSQPTFWRSQTAGDYWGLTTIQRRGFTSPEQLYGGGFSPRERLQSNQVGRTIVGKAEPGTLAQLTLGFGGRVLDEVLVDSSGIYRFENVKVDADTFGRNYQVSLYPKGRLTEPPEIREATFSTVPGQIPAGASATIISAGVGRQSETNRFLGKFTNVEGGVLKRWGVSESLTVGAGAVYDQTPRGLAEIFFRPNNIPFELSASILTPDRQKTWDIEANVFYRPTSNITARFNSDTFSQRLNLDWQLSPKFTLLGIYDTHDGAAVGIQIATSGRNAFTFARATFDQKNRWRWNLVQRLGALEFTQIGNEISTSSELTYNLSGSRFLDTGHALVLDYETINLLHTERLLTLGWRYRSQARAADGNYLWETELGYGVGSQGSGVIANAQIAVIPGLLLRLRYQGASVISGDRSYSLELVSSANLQRGIFPGDRRSDYLRTLGGLLIQPFFDRNNNGQHDPGEEYYTQTVDTLLILNNQPLKLLQPQIYADRVVVRLPPGTYRLDLDPSGFPPDWQPLVDAMAVEVVPGSYTPILIPLIPAFTLSGVVTDSSGNAVAGARVEAVASKQGLRRFSVTNGAGVYYMERLQPDTYTLLVNDEPAQPSTITLDESSKRFGELNLLQKSKVKSP